MKKITTLLLSAAMAASAVSVMPAAAAETPKNIVIIGDSIASGYGLSDDEYNYGKICGDYYGANVTNLAVPGLNSTQLVESMNSLNAIQKAALSQADVFVISIGGNDMIQYAAKVLLQYAASRTDHKFLADGISPADIPANPTATDMAKYLNIRGEDGLRDYITNGGTNAITEMIGLLTQITNNLTQTTGTYEGIIPNQTITNINAVVSEIKKNNSNARIIVQTLYQPVQLDPAFVEQVFGSGNYAQVLKQLRINFNDVINNSFNASLKAIDGVEVADVYYTFTSNEGGKSTAKNPGHTYFFTDIQKSIASGGSALSMDFHPNQIGNTAIAAAIINTIGVKENAGGLLAKTYNQFLEKKDYPEIAFNELIKAMNINIGDVSGDDEIDSADASSILTDYSFVMNGGSRELTEAQIASADVNRDNSVDSADASLVLQYYSYLMNDAGDKPLSLLEFLETDF